MEEAARVAGKATERAVGRFALAEEREVAVSRAERVARGQYVDGQCHAVWEELF